ncbi:hypothetical protein AVEN_91537-1 [Araneus ventricosus]|uniref:Uncharacterized protein n=1 Tax=Araneus ventricosus TaxID=182803 RepID=A0A4Y2BLY7_ARAVE|nr:hypothetical protein AVEN_91537-1 [Araneus ventricosus]
MKLRAKFRRRSAASNNFQTSPELMSLAYAECLLGVRESLAAHYFIDAIRDEDMQHLTRLMDAKDLKSSLAYSMEYEAARTVSKTSKHVKSIKTEVHTNREIDDKFEFFF